MTTQFTPTINHLSAIIKFDKLSNDSEVVNKISDDLTSGLNLTIVKKIENEFKPIGRTLVFILSESHLAVHTWPEFSIIHIDLLSCSNTTIDSFDKVLAMSLKNYKVLEYKSESHNI